MWTQLKNYPDYAVNELGEVYSLRKHRTLTPKHNHDGYLRIQLYENGTCRFVSIHRLIAEAFIPNPENKPFINHIDGDKTNNVVSNLEWCTQKENIAHSWKIGLSHRELNTCGKRVQQFDKAGNFIKEFPSTMAVERELGIAHTNISQSITRHGTAGGYYWRGVDDR